MGLKSVRDNILIIKQASTEQLHSEVNKDSIGEFF